MFLSTEEKINRLIEETLGIDASQLRPEMDLGEDLLADSLDLIEIVMGIEDEFSVEIFDEVAEKMHTVGDLYNFRELMKS